MALDNETDLVKSAIELRQQAIERLKTKVSEKTPPVGTEATGRLVRDLEVYQIEIEVQNTELRRAQEELENQQVELEMQNEELVRVQEELELSRNTYSELYDFAPVGYFTFDAAGVIQNANLTGALLLGIERKRLINKPFSAFIADADSRSVFSAHLKAVAQGKGIQKCEVGLTGKDGTVICGQLQSVALRAAENKSGQFLSSLSDGTAAKQLGLEIQDAREYAENIVETVRKPLMVLDSDLKILTANHSFYDTFKVVPEDTIGNFIYDLGNRQWDIPQLRVLFKNILPNDTVLNGYEVDHNFPGIGRKIILLNARQIFREKVGSHIILLAMEDITDRKKAEEELLKAGALQRAIFNSANFSSIATDQNGVIQIFNVGAERMLGYNAAEVMNLITPADISDPQELIERAKALSAELETQITPGFDALVFKARRGIEDIYELTYIRKDGSRFPAVVSVTALRDDHGSIIGYLLIGTDNTARKQADAERARLDQVLLDKNAELESAMLVADKANLAKSDFLSSMSHELRTPLGAILGFAQLIESGTPEPTPTQKRSIDQILKAGWYLLELINEILDLALIESGKLSLSLEPVSLAEVMQECEVMVEPQAQQHGITVVFTPLDTPYFVNADRTRVKQLLLNLLSNAIKYNRVDGKVTVTCSVNLPDSIRISVQDTGEGLTSEQITQLFQPFNRLGQKTDIEQGTGIGLVVCKRLVELMGGEIGVESTAGEGSVFWIDLGSTTELKTDDQAVEPTPTPQMEVQGNENMSTLLYVEDNPANMMLVEDLIARRPDIRLLTAMDAVRGIEIARTALPDAILMDINLPGISGIDALKILSADPLTAHIPIVALSANAIPRDIEKGMEAGFFRYLTKPIKVVEFMETMDMVLKHAKRTI
ncbi:MAG: PAS domain S-box protein [Desulfuromonadaceae bacterium]|nr:PAS domain S-box protein [Desulfuromonadaceae bacterium]MDD4131222.1 PAS domain S-box protein [Desulfuromonadaceae bacterium]